MKNVSKLFGIIVLAAIIGLTLTACTEGGVGDVSVSIINNNAQTLTNVKLSQQGTQLYDSGAIAIANGQTQKFDLKGITFSIIGTAHIDYSVTVGEETLTGHVFIDRNENNNLEIDNDRGFLQNLWD